MTFGRRFSADLRSSGYESSVAARQRDSVICQLVLMRIPHDQADAGQRRQFFRRALGVAAGDQNSARRGFPDGCGGWRRARPDRQMR